MHLVTVTGAKGVVVIKCCELHIGWWSHSHMLYIAINVVHLPPGCGYQPHGCGGVW